MPRPAEMKYLERCIALATEALEAGDQPFGSVLVSADGEILFEDRNRTASGDATRHPDVEIARWAARNMDEKARAAATVYTSGEHCPMCAAAHGWVGLGGIVYISSSRQLAAWLKELGARAPAVRGLPIPTIVPRLGVGGPGEGLSDRIRALYFRRHQRGYPAALRPTAGENPRCRQWGGRRCRPTRCESSCARRSWPDTAPGLRVSAGGPGYSPRWPYRLYQC